MSLSNPDRNPIEMLAEEFRERLRRGEHPEVKEYTEKFPEHAEKIRELFPALVMMERLKPARTDVTGTGDGGAAVVQAVTLERLGDYRILREVGRGGMGVVYEAVQESLGRRVALKALPSHSFLDPRQQKRFQREAKAAARLHHTNIVPVFGVGEQDGMHYYVMQFIQGLGLDQVLAELKRLPQGQRTPAASEITGTKTYASGQVQDVTAGDVARSLLSGHFAALPATGELGELNVAIEFREAGVGVIGPVAAGARTDGASGASKTIAAPRESSASLARSSAKSAPTTLSESGRHYWHSVARIGIQVADAIEYASSQGILHRDIKPSNLLLDTQGNVWVTDFGLAKATTAADGDNLTHTGDIVGTLRYMAPERFEGRSDLRSDIYSLGLTLYELLVQQAAFVETDRSKLIHQVTTEEPARPSKVNSAIPRDLETIVLKAIDREPGRRYQTAAALADDLRCFTEDRPISARRAGLVERGWRWCRRNPAVAGLTAAMLLLLVATAVGSTLAAFRFEKQASDENRLRGFAEQALKTAQDARKDAEDNLQEAERQKERAEANFRQVLRVVDDSLTKVSESRLLNVPGLQPLRKDLLESTLTYYQGFLTQRADDPTLQKDLATAYARVARITADIGSKEKALQAYQQALTIRKKLGEQDPQNLELQVEMAADQQGLGRLQQQLGDLTAALKSFQEASNILRTIIPRSRDKSALLARFATIYDDIGVTYIQKQEPLEAMSYYTAALKLQRQLVDENRQDSKVAQFRYELANELNRMGRLHSSISLFTEALKLHGEALGILKDLVRAHASDQQANDWQRALADSHESIGDVQDRENQTAAALASYQAALPVRQRLASANPAVTDYQSELAHTFFTVGLLQAKSGSLGAAVEAYQRAIERQRLVVVSAPQVAEYPRLLGREMSRLGEAYRKLGQPGEALRSYQEAVAILEKLAYAGPGDAYELACARAACSLLVGQGKAQLTSEEKEQRQKLAALALQALRDAVASGYRDLDRVKTDPELESLRSQAGFKSLLGELEKKVKVLVWNPDFDEAKAQAAREKKDLFVYFTGSDWCSWCVLVRREVFGKDAFIDYAPRHFVLVELDFPHYKANPKNYPQNHELFRKWGLDGFPSLILADAHGRPYANLRDEKVRDEAAVYVQLMEKLRPNRVTRDEFLARSLSQEGLDKAKSLDRALSLIPSDFVTAEYGEAVEQILHLDAQDKAGLRSKYLPLVLKKRQTDVKQALQKQDWDGTIVKIDKIIEELKPTGKMAADIWIERARAYAGKSQWDKADADYAKAVELKPDDTELRLERAQFYEKRGQPDKAAAEFAAAIEPKTKLVESCRQAFVKAPYGAETRNALSDAYTKLAEAQRKAGRLDDAAATALERVKLWPGNSMHVYNAACELALCVPAVDKNQALNAAQETQRRRFGEQAMELLRRSILAGFHDVAHMKSDSDLTSLRTRDDYKELVRWLELAAKFPLPTGETRALRGHTRPLVWSVAFAPDGHRVLSSAADNTVRLWDADNGKEIRRFIGHSRLVRGLTFSNDGRRVVTGGDDGTVRLWDAGSGKELQRFTGHSGPVMGVAISPDGKQVLSCGRDTTLRLWNVDTGKEIRRLPGHTAAITAVAFAADGRRALSGGDDSTVRFWDAAAGKELQHFQAAEDKVLGVALSRDGRRAAAGTLNGLVYLWNLENGRVLHRLEGDGSSVRALGFLPDDRRVLFGSFQGGLSLVDVETGRELHRFGLGLPVGGLAVAGDGRRAVTANTDGKVHLWSLAEESLRWQSLDRLGNGDEAGSAYNQLVEKQPQEVGLRIARGRFYARQQQWDKATADYTKALETKSDEPTARLERGRCHVELSQPDKAAADFDKALSLAASQPGSSSELSEIYEEVAQLNDLFAQVGKLRPRDRQLWNARLARCAPRGQWREAATALAKLTELEPANHYHWYCQAPLLLQLEDVESYRRVCREMLARFGQTKDPYIAERTAKTCLLVPSAVNDSKLVRQLSDRAITGTEKEAAYRWFVLSKGMAEYRTGQFASAVDWLKKSLSPGAENTYLDSTAYLFLAMAHHRLQQPDDAREALAKARVVMEQKFPKIENGGPGADWSDWLRFQIIRREAEALVGVAVTQAGKGGAGGHEGQAKSSPPIP